MPDVDLWVPPSTATLGVFLVIVAFVCLVGVGLQIRAAPPGRRSAQGGRSAIAVVGWLLATALVSASGILELGPPTLFGFLIVCNVTGVVLALSPVGGRIAATAPLAVLVGAHAFRLPLEVVLHLWADAGVIPVSMSWSGENFDVIAGIAALIAAPIVATAPQRMSRSVAWGFTLLGSALLANVIRVAMLSSPGPLRRFEDPPLALASHIPTVWIASVCVAGALCLHVLAFRQLMSSDQRIGASPDRK